MFFMSTSADEPVNDFVQNLLYILKPISGEHDRAAVFLSFLHKNIVHETWIDVRASPRDRIPRCLIGRVGFTGARRALRASLSLIHAHSGATSGRSNSTDRCRFVRAEGVRDRLAPVPLPTGGDDDSSSF